MADWYFPNNPALEYSFEGTDSCYGGSLGLLENTEEEGLQSRKGLEKHRAG